LPKAARKSGQLRIVRLPYAESDFFLKRRREVMKKAIGIVVGAIVSAALSACVMVPI
jgi:hypothetical protein